MRRSILTSFYLFSAVFVNAQCDTSLPNSRDGYFSPDGNKIVFSSSRDGNQDIYIMNADGSGQKRLAGTAQSDYYPTFTPDGKKILFDSYGKKTAAIFIMNIDGTDIKTLSDPLEFNTDPIMSPDQSKILFYSNRDGIDQIYVMDHDGDNQKRITKTQSNERTPVWSPDGSKIVFISGRDGNSEVYTMNVDGSAQKQITNNAGPDLVASWSPDGLKILFYGKNQPRSVDPLEQTEIMTINPDGTERENLTKDDFPDQGPTFSPDGQQILYTSCRGNRELFLMDSDGSNRKQLTFSLDKRSKEIVEIQKVVTKSYIMPLYYRGNLEDIRKGFHEGFNMYVLYNKEFSKRSLDEWIAKLYEVRERNLPQSIYNYKFESVDFEGQTAMVKLTIQEGSKHDKFIDYLSLYKFEDGWKVVTKLFTMN